MAKAHVTRLCVCVCFCVWVGGWVVGGRRRVACEQRVFCRRETACAKRARASDSPRLSLLRGAHAISRLRRGHNQKRIEKTCYCKHFLLLTLHSIYIRLRPHSIAQTFSDLGIVGVARGSGSTGKERAPAHGKKEGLEALYGQPSPKPASPHPRPLCPSKPLPMDPQRGHMDKRNNTQTGRGYPQYQIVAASPSPPPCVHTPPAGPWGDPRGAVVGAHALYDTEYYGL
jgi:hypothetical protein